MKDYLISQFIDDELNIDEKCEFVETVHASRSFKDETIDFLNQEKILRQDAVSFVPPVVWTEKRRFNKLWRRRFGLLATGLAAALLLFMVFQPPDRSKAPPMPSAMIPYRFVIFQPEAQKAQIVGSFTGWQTVPMRKSGGYFQVTMALPAGEHRFSYIIDGRQQVTDPTLPVHEPDDFGGENSILEVHPV
jgi:hypothetical protein